MDILTLGIIAIVVAAVLAIGFVLVPYLKKKGLINDQNIDATNQILQIAGLILSSLDIKNEKIKSEADTIFDISNKVVQYIEQTMKAVDNVAKKQAAIDVIKEILGKLNIQVTPDNEKLIEVGIESAVNVLPKTNT